VSLLRAEALEVSTTLDGRQARVLRDLTFSLQPGQILGLVGESGAGKSMIGRTIASDLPSGFAVSGGSLHYGNEDLVAMPRARRQGLLGREIAFIPQEPMAALNPVLTVRQQLDEHLRRIGVRDRLARARDLLAQVGLADPDAVLRRYAHQLSGGMCQRVLIAMAFASDPKLVIADEPTTALDVTIQARVIKLIAELQARSGTGVLFITHDLRLAAQICDDVLVLYAGRPAERGPSRALFKAPWHPYTASLHLAAPAMTGSRRVLLALPHQMPGLRQIAGMPGCRFAPRCPVVQADCTRSEPVMAAEAHGTACHHPDLVGQIATPEAAPIEAIANRAPEALRTSNLRRVFRSRGFFTASETVAVANADIVVHEGEFVGLVGESGSGKSTVARLVAGLDQPSSGQILLDGMHDMPRTQRLRHVQMVFQDPQSALNPRHLVGDIVTQAMRVDGRSGAADRAARAQELLAQVGLAPEIAGRTASQLSGGQRQRVNIARALCVVPKLLVADEIVSGLDVSVQAQLLDMLLELRARLGFAMLFISHDLAVVRYLCARVVVMHRGEIVEQGETESVFSAPRHDYTRTLLDAVPPD
jgi:peptide/nickel transport system ATP-binding protein